MAKLINKGGKGSGNWGHAGRPGKVGGSAPRDGAYQQGELFDTEKYEVPPDSYDALVAGGLRDESVGGTIYPPGGADTVSDNVDRTSQVVDKLMDARRDAITRILRDNPDVSERDLKRIILEWNNSSNGNANSMLIQSEAQRMFSPVFGSELSDWQNDRILYQALYGGDGGGDRYDKFANNIPAARNELARMQTMFDDGETVTEVQNRVQKVLRAVYNDTQKRLSDAGLDGVYLFRGVRGDTRENFELNERVSSGDTENVLSSWTSDPNVARQFAQDVSFVFPDEEGGNISDIPEDKRIEVNSPGRVLAMYVPRERILAAPGSAFGHDEEKEFVVIDAFGVSDDEQRVVATYQEGVGDENIKEDDTLYPDSVENRHNQYIYSATSWGYNTNDEE